MKKIYYQIKNSFYNSLFPVGKRNELLAFGGVWVLIPIFAGLFLIGFLIAKKEKNYLETFKHTKILMGTVVEIQVRDTDEEKAKYAISKAFDEIKRIDDLFSSHNEGSDVWKINHSSHRTNVSEELFELLVFSDSIWRMSNGSFDISLGNLIDLWNFKAEHPTLPTKEKLIKNISSSGWRNVQLKNYNSIFLNNNVKLDFGAVAKGYAVDKAVDVLKQSGVFAALVNAGGEVKGFGEKWIVGIQHPRNRHELLGKLKLYGISVATSGDYEQYFELNGKRYHHILNPKTGFPIDGCQSVTVICRENKLADALATAIFVLGETEGMKLVERFNDVEVLIVNSSGNIVCSRGFNKFLVR